MTREELEQMKQEEPNSMSPRYEYIKGWNDAIDAVEENEPKQGELDEFFKAFPELDIEPYNTWNCGARMKEGDENGKC